MTFIEKKSYDENIVINPFGKTFDNVDLELLFGAVKSKTLLENSSKYQDEKNLSLKMSPISSFG